MLTQHTGCKQLQQQQAAAEITALCTAVMLYCNPLQVADNGRGIAPNDYEALALKYHTSKLAQFDDLEVRAAAAAAPCEADNGVAA
jgi:DNA mismatch repair protein PMS2